MEKIKFIVDSPSDIPEEDLARYNIDMMAVPITVDGEGYFERKSFTIQEFYTVLSQSTEIPTTSRVPAFDFRDAFHKAWQEGYKTIICVTINAGGSGTYQSAVMGMQMFFEENPQAVESIALHVLDSKTYTVAYGWPVMEGAKMAQEGRSSAEILEFMQEWFDSLEIYLATYTLEYAKKSGRISAAAAFVGDVLGLRPIISMIDGTTKVVEKVRGEKQVIPKLLELYEKQCTDSKAPCFIVKGSVDEYADQLSALFMEKYGWAPPVYNAGASIVINSGPKIVALVCKGKKRTK
ncbi:DegV family protein [Oscillospiraceae bacterium MB08-C2-2]|nr:DegV family protein [Oscillospiraceae bacterium MB08-C2-2]